MVTLRDRVHTYICVNIRMYVNMYVCNTHTDQYTHTYVESPMYRSTYCTCVHACTGTYVHLYNIHNIIQIYVHIHMYVRTM